MMGINGKDFYKGSDWIDTMIPGDFQGGKEIEILAIKPRENSYDLVRIGK